MMAAEGPERDPRALPLNAVGNGAVRRGRPLGGGFGPSETRERAAVPWQPAGSVPQSLYTAEQEARIAELFRMALDGELTQFRRRELKANEPDRLNERHFGMISLRATGLHQRLIAKAYGDNDLYVHQVLNHPDAQYLLTQLIAMRASAGNQYQERMEALAEPAMSAIEDALLDDDPDTVKIALKKAPLAFRVLEQGGKIKKPAAEGRVDHTHRFEASPQQMGLLREALLESRELKNVPYRVAEIEEDGSRQVRQLSAVAGSDFDSDGHEAVAAQQPSSGDGAGGEEGGEAEAGTPQARLVAGWDD